MTMSPMETIPILNHIVVGETSENSAVAILLYPEQDLLLTAGNAGTAYIAET